VHCFCMEWPLETRQKDCMRRHLLVSRRCRELKPIVIHPKEEGWKLW
jgi:hypothetical protein